jgi:glutathione S-transferase
MRVVQCGADGEQYTHDVITLYQIHWSHFVEKVRWALDYKRVEWSAVEVEPFSKREMQHLQRRTTLDSGRRLYTVPVIHDQATGAVVGESSQILEYLERTHPIPALYPAADADRAEVVRWMLWLDSTLGLAARRLAYTQIAVEHPGLLAELFIPRGRFRGALAGAIIGGILARRFRFLHNRADRVFERVEDCLLFAAERLASRQYLVGERFTAADLTLAALMRPVAVVPFFREHPHLQGLFEWRSMQLHEHRREPQISYEDALGAVRRRRRWARGAVSWRTQRRDRSSLPAVPVIEKAHNDQQSVGRRPLITGPLWYLGLKLSCGLGRTPY